MIRPQAQQQQQIGPIHPPFGNTEPGYPIQIGPIHPPLGVQPDQQHMFGNGLMGSFMPQQFGQPQMAPAYRPQLQGYGGGFNQWGPGSMGMLGGYR